MASLKKEPFSWKLVLGTAALVFVAVMAFFMLRGGSGGLPGENGWDGGVYRSEFLGLAFTLPEGWEKWDERKLGQASAGDAKGAERARIQDTYLMWAGQSSEELAVYIQAAQVAGERTTQAAGNELLDFYSAMDGVTARRLDDQIIAGESYYALSLLAGDGEEAARQCLFVRMQDDYAVSISLAGKQDSELTWILDCFQKTA